MDSGGNNPSTLTLPSPRDLLSEQQRFIDVCGSTSSPVSPAHNPSGRVRRNEATVSSQSKLEPWSRCPKHAGTLLSQGASAETRQSASMPKTPRVAYTCLSTRSKALSPPPQRKHIAWNYGKSSNIISGSPKAERKKRKEKKAIVSSRSPARPSAACCQPPWAPSDTCG